MKLYFVTLIKCLLIATNHSKKQTDIFVAIALYIVKINAKLNILSGMSLANVIVFVSTPLEDYIKSKLP